jgi:DnaK suppressor protein
MTEHIESSSSKAQGETGVDVARCRQRLRALEHELVRRLQDDAGRGRDAHDDQASAGDQAQVDENKDMDFALAQNDSELLHSVRGALERIANGTYGQCLVDGGEIEPERLEAEPWTPFCLKHQRELERGARKRTPTM